MSTAYARWSDEQRGFHIHVDEASAQADERPALQSIVDDFPLLANALRTFASGNLWFPTTLDQKTGKLVAIAVFAALGQQDHLRRYADRALDEGIAEDELREVVYLTTVPAGGLRALEAAETLTTLLQERRRSGL
jgi:4-carboxymuconolactone decarboxylase